MKSYLKVNHTRKRLIQEHGLGSILKKETKVAQQEQTVVT
jgi:hypothetical protein